MFKRDTRRHDFGQRERIGAGPRLSILHSLRDRRSYKGNNPFDVYGS
jgi:hypothetical protein